MKKKTITRALLKSDTHLARSQESATTHTDVQPFLGRLKGMIKILGDIESPVEPPEAWEYD